MSLSGALAIIEELRRTLSAAKDKCALSAALEAFARRYLNCREVKIRFEDDRAPAAGQDIFCLRSDGVYLQELMLPLPLFVSEVSRSRLSTPLLEALRRQGLHSFALVPLYRDAHLWGVMELHFRGRHHRWQRQEALLLQQAADLCSMRAEEFLTPPGGRQTAPLGSGTDQHELRSGYQRIARYGNLLLVRTDHELRVSEVVGDPENILGLSTEEMLRDKEMWVRCVHATDLRRLISRSQRRRPSELAEEIRVINQRTGAMRWLLLRAAPFFDSASVLAGWEGCGVDITDRHNAQEELVLQRQRIEALYTVARSLQSNFDPALVTLQGLRAVLRATKSDCGFGCLYDSGGTELEIAAAHGLPAPYLAALSKKINADSPLKRTVEEAKGRLIDDLQQQPDAEGWLVRQEGLHSAIVVPLISDRNVVGALVLMRRQPSRYSAADYDLVMAASQQIAMAVRQAELYAAEKRQANSLASLYRLSHELSKQVTLKEVIEHAFPVIQEELACKRMWLGVLNERGTHIVGQAGSGPGVRQSVIDLQIELNQRHDFLDQALRSKQPVMVEEGQTMECSGLNRLLSRLRCGTFVIVPLVALGQVVGVLLVEPAGAPAFFAQRKLLLLNSMASEIATVILARRFEARMAEADKMRMAGLLAAGIAHNFNNLLQAVMGQASLIEMQAGPNSRLSGSARMITDAASKGAALVRQLFSFSSPESFTPKLLDLKQLLIESEDLYRSALGGNVALQFNLGSQACEVLADAGQLQQVFTNLLVNAREAIGAKEGGRVIVSAAQVRLRSGEVDPELAPGVYWRLDFEDNGAGMDTEQQNRCFEPFYTTKNVDQRTGLGFGGSGLGLPTAYSIMRQHDGLITVRSIPGHGSTFSLYLPVGGDKGLPAQREAPLSSEDFLQAAIFNLDDNACYAVKSTLETLNVRLAPAEANLDLYVYLQQSSSKALLVIVDLDKLGVGFAEFISRIRKIKPGSWFVGTCSDRSRWQRILAGTRAVELVEKPAGLWAMNSALTRAVSRLRSAALSDAVEKNVHDDAARSRVSLPVPERESTVHKLN